MMSNEEVRGRASWRKAIVPIAATAATVIGGMVLATPANAATAPTVTVTAPSKIANDGVNTGNIVITTTNPTTGAALSNVRTFIDIAVPAGLPCGNITLTPAPASTVASPPAGHCQWYFDTASIPADGTPSTTTIGLKVNGSVPNPGAPPTVITGTLNTTVSLLQLSQAAPGETVTGTLATASANTALVNPVFPTLTLAQNTGVGSIPNNGAAAPTYKLTFGAVPADGGATETDNVQYTVTVPTGVVTTDVTMNDGGAVGLTCTGTTCVGNSANTQALSPGVTPTARTITLTIDHANVTGNVTIQAALVDPASKAVRSTSNTLTTALVAPAAVAFASGAVPAAVVYQPYAYKLVTNPGFGATATYTAYGYHKNADGSYCTTTQNEAAGEIALGQPTDTTDCGTADLSVTNDFALITDTASKQFGQIVADVAATKNVMSAPYYTWFVVANNTIGAGTTPTSPAPAGSGVAYTAQPNDVISPTFTLPILFKDTAVNSTFGKEIYQLAEEGVIGGYADGTFRGSQAVSRQAMAHFIAVTVWKDQGLPGSPSTNAPCNAPGAGPNPSAFSDVLWTDAFCADINYLAAVGITTGYPDGTFHPGENITRQAISAFIYRADAVHRNVPKASIGDAACTVPTGFNDVDASNRFCGDIQWMKNNGITTGYPDGGFHPLGNTSREATAAFLSRLQTLWTP